MIDLSIKRDADEDEWLAVKADVFKNDSSPCVSSAASSSFKKRQPNFHVNWNENEQKFCLTFNENSRVKSDTKQKCSFSSSFNADQLIYVHKNLAYLVPELADDDSKSGDSTKKFYDFFPEFPRSTWSEYFLTKIVAKPTEISDWRSYMYYFARTSCPTSLMDKLCLKLENYFAYAYQKCSHFAFMSTLFPENFGVDEYFENLSELRHKTYAENLDKSTANFRFLLENRRKTMIALSKSSKNLDSSLELNERFFFDELDSSVEEILNLLAEYYTYLREPFLDLREISRAQIDLWKRTLEEDFDVGDRVKLTVKEKLVAKRQEYKDCAENLQELQLQYYTGTKKLLFEYLSALKAEKVRNRLKSSARNVDPNVAQFLTVKIFDLEKRVAFADVNFCACQLWPIRQKRKTILNRIARLDVTSSNLNNMLKNLEQEFFEAQKDYYSTEIQILSAQDKYIRFQLNEIRRNTNISSNTGETDEDGDIFYDAPDSEREIRKFLDKYSCDQPKIHSLKCRMDHVNRQLAILRNKKKIFEEKINEGKGAVFSSLIPGATFGNCDLKSLLENENNKNIYRSTEKLKLDRRTTIERIRSYRAKNNLKTMKNPTSTSKAQTKLGIPVKSKCLSNQIAARETKIDVPPATKLVALPNVAPLLPPPPPPPPLPLNFILSTQNLNPKYSSSADLDEDSSKKSASKKPTVTSTMVNNNMDSIVSAIKSGSIKLKKVEQQQRQNRKSSPLKDDGSSSGRLLAEMMSKIRNLAHLSSDDDDEDSDAELNDEFDSS